MGSDPSTAFRIIKTLLRQAQYLRRSVSHQRIISDKIKCNENGLKHDNLFGGNGVDNTVNIITSK